MLPVAHRPLHRLPSQQAIRRPPQGRDRGSKQPEVSHQSCSTANSCTEASALPCAFGPAIDIGQRGHWG